ncbi:MAG: hypothetical protein MHM6MM_004118 [Cercozoa sp. M6MM]
MMAWVDPSLGCCNSWNTTRSLESLTALLRDIVCVNAFTEPSGCAPEPSSFEHLLARENTN